jgi:competence protein ComEA
VARATTVPGQGDEHTGVNDIVIGTSWRDRLENIAGRRRDVAVVLAVVAAVVVVAVAVRATRSPVIAPPTPAVAAPTPSSGTMLVHVAGAVRVPGLYELPIQARVADAIAAAGGPRTRADLDALNLAEVLSDGLKVYVPPIGEAPAASSPHPTAPQTVRLNSADQAALESIVGIGPAKAAAILAYRDEIGSFTAIEQLLDVDGIGPATLEAIRPYVTL